MNINDEIVIDEIETNTSSNDASNANESNTNNYEDNNTVSSVPTSYLAETITSPSCDDEVEKNDVNNSYSNKAANVIDSLKNGGGGESTLTFADDYISVTLTVSEEFVPPVLEDDLATEDLNSTPIMSQRPSQPQNDFIPEQLPNLPSSSSHREEVETSDSIQSSRAQTELDENETTLSSQLSAILDGDAYDNMRGRQSSEPKSSMDHSDCPNDINDDEHSQSIHTQVSNNSNFQPIDAEIVNLNKMTESGTSSSLSPPTDSCHVQDSPEAYTWQQIVDMTEQKMKQTHESSHDPYQLENIASTDFIDVVNFLPNTTTKSVPLTIRSQQEVLSNLILRAAASTHVNSMTHEAPETERIEPAAAAAASMNETHCETPSCALPSEIIDEGRIIYNQEANLNKSLPIQQLKSEMSDGQALCDTTANTQNDNTVEANKAIVHTTSDFFDIIHGKATEDSDHVANSDFLSVSSAQKEEIISSRKEMPPAPAVFEDWVRSSVVTSLQPSSHVERRRLSAKGLVPSKVYDGVPKEESLFPIDSLYDTDLRERDDISSKYTDQMTFSHPPTSLISTPISPRILLGAGSNHSRQDTISTALDHFDPITTRSSRQLPPPQSPSKTPPTHRSATSSWSPLPVPTTPSSGGEGNAQSGGGGGRLWRLAGEIAKRQQQNGASQSIKRNANMWTQALIVEHMRSRADPDALITPPTPPRPNRSNQQYMLAQLHEQDEEFLLYTGLWANKRVRVVQLLIIGLVGVLLGWLGNFFVSSSCYFAAINVSVGQDGDMFSLHFGLWNYSPVDSALNGYKYCYPYGGSHVADAPLISRSVNILALLLGTYSLVVLWLYLITGRAMIILWKGAVYASVMAGLCQLLTLHFFFGSMCKNKDCEAGPGAIISIITAIVWVILGAEMHYHCPIPPEIDSIAALSSLSSADSFYSSQENSISPILTSNLEMADIKGASQEYFERFKKKKKKGYRPPELRDLTSSVV